ncbi:DUF1194 domain-containing protein [Hyphomicrobium sp.]|uniref:DUF1194 domain-containing protein n=1 Tax=Hyphomicrobium sp. TaxID=82 RepID=UPI002FE08460
MRSRVSAAAWGLFAAVALVAAGTVGPSMLSRASAGAQQPDVDTALIVSVDVSNSVDEHRYKLQMEGIAKALEDPDVLKAILNGPQGGILFSMVTWADKPKLALPWLRIASAADAAAAAARVRTLPRQTGEFTCVSGMLRSISDKVVPQIPAKALRIVVDVSGDGRENCNPNEPPALVRDELAAGGVTVNGLPILEGEEGPVLEQWYRDNVMGGPGGFVLPADGFDDFGRAIRQKFMIEISGLPLPIKEARASD